MTKRILMIAGPNGSGKTTTALALEPEMLNLYEFLNADEIARGLAPFHPDSMAISASKLMVQRLKELLSLHKSFAFETTGAGINYVKHLKNARQQGYEISLLFLWLGSADLAVKRVANRVAEGGHHIPEETIRRRYPLGIKNLVKHYLPLSHKAVVIDNSTEQRKVIVNKNIENDAEIRDRKIWEEILRIADD